MDFRFHYTEEQERFRNEVRAWIRENYPPELEPLHIYGAMTEKVFTLAREFRHKLGGKGWLAPLFPREYGGGGLSVDDAIVLAEELWELDVPRVSDLGLALAAPAIMAWGTEDQKRWLLPPILRGEVITWQCFTEPEAGSDEANQQTAAVRNGDSYIINGQKIFVGGFGQVDFLYTLAVTDRRAPRHRNLGAFLVPANLPGITIRTLDVVTGGTERQIFFEDVQVPVSQLIGKETDGWQVSRTTLDVEHGGGVLQFARRDRLVESLFAYCRDTQRNGQPLTKDPYVQRTMVDVYIDSEVERVLGMRNWWMLNARQPMTYEGLQYWLCQKLRWPKLAGQILQMLGPYALTTDPNYSALKGELESYHRQSFLTHAGGTPEVLKVIMARALGIGKSTLGGSGK